MTLHDLATPCGHEHMTKPWCVNTQGHTFSLLLEHCAPLPVADMSNYSTEKCLVANV